MKYAPLLAGLCLGLAAGHAPAAPTLMLRQPDLSADHLAFVYAGDLWIANRDGSIPRRLTSGAAEENTPLFSPDGTKVAFLSNAENNVDVYVIDAAGGQPRRLTWHPGRDVPTGWTADGKAVTFVSAMETDHGRSGQLYHASLAGGLPQGRWTIENEGVAPDIEATLDPIATNNGRDTQLEAAIADVMVQLKTHKDSVPRAAPALPTELGK